MKITIIGWYGTETIGDRAILAGLISFFHKAYGDFSIQLGSLNPFFSERSINEDYAFYKEIIGKEIDIIIFNSKDSKELLQTIKSSNLVAMGGGPLMDLSELFMVEYAFKKARKLGIRTALLGCGIGPLFVKKYRKSVLNISLNSDISILRDSTSKKNLEDVYDEFKKPFNSKYITTSYDPAVESTLEFNRLNKKRTESYIAINLREFPLEYNKENDSKNINEALKVFVNEVALKYPSRTIKLIPMHYFHVGGDDRMFLNAISGELNLDNIEVQNKNLTLKQTMMVYQNADFNIGMRFHSVVLQTISSAKNYVLDYTEPKKGKIFGFLSDIDEQEFFKERYISLQEDEINTGIIKSTEEVFDFDEQAIQKRLNVYIKKLKACQS